MTEGGRVYKLHRAAHPYRGDARIKKRAIVREWRLTHPCVDCGETDPVVLQFDHRDPQAKAASISSMVQAGSVTRLLLEMGKCDSRCANCHIRKTRANGDHLTVRPAAISRAMQPYHALPCRHCAAPVPRAAATGPQAIYCSTECRRAADKARTQARLAAARAA